MSVALWGAITGTVSLLAYVTNYVSTLEDRHKERQITQSLKQLDRYLSLEFISVRRHAWDLAKKCKDSEASFEALVDYFLDRHYDNKDAEPNQMLDNELTPYQNMSALLSFWHRLLVLVEGDLVIPSLIHRLKSDYAHWQPFFDKLISRCQTKHAHGPSTLPILWVGAIPRLNRFFKNVDVHEENAFGP